YMLGAYFLFELSSNLGLPVWGAILLAVVGVFLVSVLIERGIMRFTYGKEHLIQLLATYALVLVIADLALIVWGTTSRSVENPLPGSFELFGIQLPTYRLVVIVIALVVGLGLWLVLARTRLGWMIRASSE